MALRESLRAAQAAISARINVAVGPRDSAIADAMGYACEGGKALRGFLVLESARILGAPSAEAPAAGIECLHAYSLIHDDLPCMDDDDLRRGRATVHKRWDEATAVLAGDALQSLAFELVLEAGNVRLAQSLARAAGLRGMVGGQAMDIVAETAENPPSLAETETLQAGKTGALITWSACAGARLAGADISPFQTYGDGIGLAFQIWDDVLDVEGDIGTVGKAVGKDAEAGKATFVSVLGLDEAKRRARDLVTEACDSLSLYGEDADTLRELARFVITRDK